MIDGSERPAEGTVVDIAPVASEAMQLERGSAESISEAVVSGARWSGEAQELDRLLAELTEMKRAEARAQLDAERDAVNPLDQAR